MEQFVDKLQNMQLHGDENDGEPKGDVVNYALMSFNDLEPPNFEQACTNNLWRKAMKEEMHSIKRNDTWELVTGKRRARKMICNHQKSMAYSNPQIQTYKILLILFISMLSMFLICTNIKYL